MNDEKHSSSKPPPSRDASLPDWAAGKAVEAKTLSKQAIEVATEARDGVQRIEGLLGESPDPVRKVVGSGLLGGVAEILEDIKAIKATASANAAARAKWASFGRGALAILGGAVTLISLIKALGGGH